MRLAGSFLFAVTAGLLAASQADAQASPSAYTTGYRFDAMHRLVGTISPDPDGTGPLHYAATRNTYDGAGRLIKIEKGELSTWESETVAPSSWSTAFTILETTTIAYDNQSRKVQETLSGGGAVQTVTQYNYDAQSNLQCTAVRMNPAGTLPASACTQTSPTPADGPDRITKNIYDAADQLIQVRNGVGTSLERAEATYSYTSTGKREYTIDGNGNRAQFIYDGHDRLSQWIFPSTTRAASFNDSTQSAALSSAGSANTADFEQYSYDNQGNRTSLRKRDGKVLTYQYDGLNRMTLKIVPDQAGFDSYYTTGDVYYGYDAEGHMTFARFNSTTGQGITNSYNGFGELASSTSDLGGTARTLSYLYDADGNRIRLTHPDGNYFWTQFDGLDRPYNFFWHTTSDWWLETITYDSLGRRGSANRGNTPISYAYDGASRLSGLGYDFAGTTNDLSTTLAYNPASDIKTETRSNSLFSWNGAVSVNRGYTTNGLNQYTTAGPASFAYDPNGNLTSDGTNSYAYDPENRLVWDGGTSTSLFYDPLGRLWKINAGTGNTQFLYDGDELAAEYDGSGNLLKRYHFGPGTDEPDFVDLGGLNCSATYFLHADHEGSIIAATGCGNNVTSINSYDEYGIPGAHNWGRFQYTGQQWIPELGMYYYKARFYSPTLGRFMQTDPVGYDGGINMYEYALDNPINQSDATGLDPRVVTFDVAGRTITIKVPVLLSGSGVTPHSLSDIQAVGAQIHAPPGQWTIHVNIVQAQSPTGDTQTVNLSPRRDYSNYNNGEGEGNNLNGQIHIDSRRQDAAAAAVHDLFHGGRGGMEGAVDRYHVTETDTHGHATASAPDPGYENNIMGTTNGRELTNDQVNQEIAPVSVMREENGPQ
jgi:RHS repeat-associated protein